MKRDYYQWLFSFCLPQLLLIREPKISELYTIYNTANCSEVPHLRFLALSYFFGELFSETSMHCFDQFLSSCPKDTSEIQQTGAKKFLRFRQSMFIFKLFYFVFIFDRFSFLNAADTQLAIPPF